MKIVRTVLAIAALAAVVAWAPAASTPPDECYPETPAAQSDDGCCDYDQCPTTTTSSTIPETTTTTVPPTTVVVPGPQGPPGPVGPQGPAGPVVVAPVAVPVVAVPRFTG